MASIAHILQAGGSMAVVGLSPNPQRSSHTVAAFMQKHGWRIIPVNPQAAGQSILGEMCYPDLQSAARAQQDKGARIDLVNVFRKSEDVPPVLEDTLAIASLAQVKTFWLQLGISHAESEKRAAQAGLQVVANRCIKVEYQRLT